MLRPHRSVFPAAVVALALAGCGQPSMPSERAPAPSSSAPTPDATPTATPTAAPPVPVPGLFAEPVRSARAAPIAGGTLLVTTDGTTAVAADPDRDRVFLVDLASHAVRSVAVDAGAELGRVVEGPAGTVFVAARRGGSVLAIDLATASVRSRITACNAPRGLAYDPTLGRLHVACRSGRLLTLDAASGALLSALELEEDLRDVLAIDGALVVTRFRSAEVLVLDGSGTLRARSTPPPFTGTRPGVAFRAIGTPSGTVMLAHQLDRDTPLGTGFGAYYGGTCSGAGVVQQVMTTMSLDGAPFAIETARFGRLASPSEAALPMLSQVIAGALGPLDLAISQDGARLAVVASGNSWDITTRLPTLFVAALDPARGVPPLELGIGTCSGSDHAKILTGEPVAVAFDAAGRYLVQSREPATLELEGDVLIPLSAESHFDTGFSLFHLNSSGGISCASCHPEGGEDGHTWSFSGVGLRRSQALEAGVGSRAPFHWSGDLAGFDELFGEVMMKRMALPVLPPPEHVAALAAWLDTLPALPPADGLDQAAVERGRALFHDRTVECGHCHSGPAFTDNRIADVGTGGAFVTPSLLGVGLRAPLMHDGCATTLRARFGICGGSAHGNTSHLSESDLDALVTFMRSL